MRMVLGIDLGTSGTKALLLNERGTIVATTEVPHSIQTPRPGWSEQDPRAWWKSTHQAIEQLLNSKPAARKHIEAIALSGQMHGSVFLDADQKPLRSAILWNDQRTSAECQEIIQRTGGLKNLLRYTSNAALPGYTAPKVLWLRNHEPALYRKFRTLLLPKDFIVMKMTGTLATDAGDASGTLLFNVRKRRWHRKLMTLLDLDMSLLPRVHESTEVVGELLPALRKKWRLEQPTITVAAGSGDQQAAAIGMGVLNAGEASITLGTSGVVFAAADTPVRNQRGLLQSFCHALPDRWCVFGCMLSAGASVEWLRETLFNTLSTQQLLRIAARAKAGSSGLFFLPYLNGERCPHPDPNSRACWVGLHHTHTRSELARAALEGVGYGLKDQLRLLSKEGVELRSLRCAGGGSRSPFWQQLQTDIFGIPTTRLDTPHASALGAALIAGTASGVWPDLHTACKQSVRTRSRTQPKQKSRYKKSYEIYRSLYPALKPTFDRIQTISAT